MKIDSRKNMKLMRQYPFVVDIIEQIGKSSITNLIIKVQKADADLMYRQPCNSGSIIDEVLTGSDRILKREEFLLAIGDDGLVINRVDWPKSEDEKHKNMNLFGCAVLYVKGDADQGNDVKYIGDAIKYLVWVTVDGRYMKTNPSETLQSGIGKLIDCAVAVIIYKKPAQGFADLETHSRRTDNLIITGDTLTYGVIKNDYEMIKIGGRLDELCQTFCEDVFVNGMYAQVVDSDCFFSGRFGSVEAIYYQSQIKLRDSQSWITFQIASEDHLYIYDMHGRFPELRNLIRSVVRVWQNSENRANFKLDVSIW
jgi:hypothetical protein